MQPTYFLKYTLFIAKKSLIARYNELKKKVMQSNNQEFGCLLGVTPFNILMRLKQPTNHSPKLKHDKLGFSSTISFFLWQRANSKLIISVSISVIFV